ncbi:Tannase feruloyl esterase protein [Rutstroemia sp. NJR-2017a BVV2]|nr:Tannase feruloyl esterase protein [Rutstroemia sp. NJR-2017a BVV2]
MRSNALFLVSGATTATAASLASVCSTSHISSALSAIENINGITLNANSVTANAVYNETHTGETFFPDDTINYCNVTFSYTHNGLNDTVLLGYYMPAPSDYKNRFLATGGGGFAINSGAMSGPGGVMYGAAAGYTDGGFGGFSVNLDAVNLLGNGTVNWPAIYMFGYQGIKEMTMIGKQFTQQFYGSTNGTKLYTYYQGCSEGGREGWSQAQRAGEEYDGIITGAPALRYGQQQVNHLFPDVVEQTLNYYPPPCELAKIVNETIAACDPLDGKTDGVISRSDLCQLQFNMSSLVGTPYACAATTGRGGFGKRQMPGGSSEPAQNGTISEDGVRVAQTIVDGLHDSEGRRAYISYQIGAAFDDASTQYNADTGKWELELNSFGGEWVARFLQLLEVDSLSTLDNVTYDTLKGWMIQGMEMYTDSLQTTLADLTPIHSNGGKILHFHGEQDASIPTGSSVHWYESVRSVMYSNQTYNESVSSLNDWYRFYIVPGAAHCAINTLQPNGPFPQTNLAVMIDWVENNITPTTLNATVLSGDYKGANGQICAWPLRPMWKNNSTMDCVYDQEGINTFMYDFNAYKLPLY